MKLKCIKQEEGFTLNKEYELLGCAGEYVEVEDNYKQTTILHENHFEIVSK